jgi:hypothetical protein
MRSTNKFDPSNEESFQAIGEKEGGSGGAGGRGGEGSLTGIEYALDPEDILGDLRMIHREWSLNCQKFQSSRAVAGQVDCKVREGELVCGKVQFKNGDAVSIRSSYTNEEFHGCIAMIKTEEVRGETGGGRLRVCARACVRVLRSCSAFVWDALWSCWGRAGVVLEDERYARIRAFCAE